MKKIQLQVSDFNFTLDIETDFYFDKQITSNKVFQIIWKWEKNNKENLLDYLNKKKYSIKKIWYKYTIIGWESVYNYIEKY